MKRNNASVRTVKIPSLTKWAPSQQGFYLAETRRPITLAPHQHDILNHVFRLGESGRFPYETILYSCPKKSGKTTLAAVAALWFGLFIDAPNEVYICANDLEQSIGRVFKDVERAIRLNPVLAGRLRTQARIIYTDEGTTIQALPSDYAGAAGSRHGLTVWDELWGYTSESARRLWDELTPVPTRKNSIRFVVSYAGYEGESSLLEELDKRGQAGEVVPELAHIQNGRGEPACRANGRTFVYWDHELKPHPGLSISPRQYHEQQRKDLRPGAFARMHLNEWASNTERFVTEEEWSECFSPAVELLKPDDTRRIVLGADASTSRDFTALVGCWRKPADGAVHAVFCKVWRPQRMGLRLGKPTIDLDTTIKEEILRLYRAGRVQSVVYDPYQLHSIAVDLEKAGVHMVELPQTSARTKADQALYDAIIGRNLLHANHSILNEHVNNAVAIETARGFRLAKEKTTKKIDAAVALSMAHFEASNKRYGKPGSMRYA